ncbi:lysozyme inhibitor LprI family protein [Paracoccus onubensis]|uniref:DUF1311 domain-containing protein n=1 Tax=Paracoccus onubensis TaxID=1675788 RepID=A0A418T482_9RHOB|nr:lysozyme inhibitor LprI family protein [Paracoccus onubensis]RJE87996.1 DUF1311 domain-containing protein [Paracoccus onubensis]
MRGLVFAVCVMAGTASAQEPGMPEIDPLVLETCRENASQPAEQGDDADAESCIGVAAARCMEEEGGYSTAGMSHCTMQERDLWDRYLNDVYRAVMQAAEEADRINADADPAAPKQVPLLKEMQRDWIAFRDSSCAFERSIWGSGTGAATATANCLLSMTAQQTIRLERHRDRGDAG